MKKIYSTFAIILLFLLLPGSAFARGSDRVKVNFVYQLASFSGVAPYNVVPVAVDAERGEAYVADTVNRSVVIYNDQGMEVFRFGDDQELGNILDVALPPDGSILLLSRFSSSAAAKEAGRGYELIRCNYRGEAQERFAVTELPPAHEGFTPSRMVLHSGRLYFADQNALLVVITELQGRFEKAFDLMELMGNPEEGHEGMSGFNVDPEGNILFTIPTMFAAYRVTPEGEIRGFGSAGSTPGKFNVLGGIAADSRGFIYVVDVLRCVVIVFDSQHRFCTEFGFRTAAPGGLVAPQRVVVTPGNKVLVTQRGGRGINVYRLSHS